MSSDPSIARDRSDVGTSVSFGWARESQLPISAFDQAQEMSEMFPARYDSRQNRVEVSDGLSGLRDLENSITLGAVPAVFFPPSPLSVVQLQFKFSSNEDDV